MESLPKKSGIVFWTSQDVKLQCKKIFWLIFFVLRLASRYSENFLRKEVSDFFDEKDRDYDGCLSFGEFMGEETPLEKVFKNMDKDGDGSITKQVWNELNPWVCSHISLQEFLLIAKHLTPEQVEEGFSKFDTSGDNKYAEYNVQKTL